METLIASYSEKVEFPEVNPQNLICFTNEYKNLLPDLMTYLSEQKGRIIDILLARIGCGVLNKTHVHGFLKEVNSDNFVIISNRDFSSEYDFDKETLVHFDNITGDVPLLLSMEKLNPFDLSGSNFLQFYKRIQDSRRIMKKGVDCLHNAILTINKIDKKDVIECEIVKVNRSNVEIKHIRTTDTNNSTIDIVPGTRFIKFITPKACICKVQMNFGVKNNINVHDDED